ncbi:MAG: DUF2149 domain-containing protein [Rhodocyclaceae bacterium]|nr:DUF2149 domain-containing protein [Rhodocyclaceae bacterium]
MSRSLLDDDIDDDPLLSVVNLIDVFLVLIAALLLAVAARPDSPFTGDRVTIIRHAGEPDMEILIRDGERMERYRADGSTGNGGGVRVGAAYRLPDGSMIYVPE